MFSSTGHGVSGVGSPSSSGSNTLGTAGLKSRRTTIDPSQDILPTNEKQIRRYWEVCIRSLITLILIGAIAAVIQIYEKKGPLTRGQKYLYNTMIIFSTLLLAINMTIAYSHVVLLTREGIVYRSPSISHPWSFRFEQKFRKITGLRSSLSFIAQELKPSNQNPHPYSVIASSVFVVIWFIFNLSVAVAIALIGLTYSLEEVGIGKSPGYVSILDTKHFYVNPKSTDPPTNPITERVVAKLYADISVGYEDTTPERPGSDDHHQVERLGNGWQYNFRESDTKGKITVRSNRYIKTHAVCQRRQIIDFDVDTFTLKYTKESGEVISIKDILVIPGRTTYISQFDSKSDSEDIIPCKHDPRRCGRIRVVQMDSWNNFTNAFLYRCESSVSNVIGGTLPEHEIPDAVALIAATSLSHNGFLDPDTSFSVAYYMNGVGWGQSVEGDANRMGEIISRAAAGSLAAMDQLNPRRIVPGLEPWGGVVLRVRWSRLIALLSVIGFLQLVAAISSIIWHRWNVNSARDSAASGIAAIGAALGVYGGAPGLGDPNLNHPPTNPSMHGYAPATGTFSSPFAWPNANTYTWPPQDHGSTGLGFPTDPDPPPTGHTSSHAPQTPVTHSGSPPPGGFAPVSVQTPTSQFPSP